MMASSPGPTTACIASYSASVPPQVTVISVCGSNRRCSRCSLPGDLLAQLDHALHGRVLIAPLADHLDQRVAQARIDRIIRKSLPDIERVFLECTARHHREYRRPHVRQFAGESQIKLQFLQATPERAGVDSVLAQFLRGREAALARCANQQYRAAGFKQLRISEQCLHGNMP